MERIDLESIALESITGGGYTPYPLGGLQHNVLLIGLQLLFRKFLEMFFEAVQGESHRARNRLTQAAGEAPW